MDPQRSRSRPPNREPLDALAGLIAGAIWGAALWLWLLPSTWPVLLPMVILSALDFAGLGYFKGNDFFRWVRRD
jgi:hypothetical protein